MSKRYPGNFITGNPVALSQTSNSGIWDLKDQYQAQNNGTWQEADGIYEIGRSLRFRGSASQTLSRTPTVSGNRKVWTWSAWVKRGQLESGATDRILFSSPSFPSTNDGIAAIYFNADQLHTYYDTSGANPYGAVGPRLYRDPSAWYHIVWSVDAANTRHRVWVNNELVSTDTSKYPPNYEYTMNNSGYTHTMGTQAWGATNYFDGYMAEVNFVDGQELDPSYFGYTDAITNIWHPKRYTGAYGTNGFYILGNTTPETNFANYIGGGSSGNYLTAPYSTDFALTNQDFTLEAFVYAGEAFSQNDHGIFNFGENVTSVNGKSLIFTGYSSGSTSPARSLRMAASSNGSTNNLIDYVEVGNIELYTWNHVAVTRTGGYIYVNINGKRTYSYNIGSTSLYNQTTYGPSIAAYRNSGSFAAVSSWPGAISNVRFTIGQCLYTGTSFTVPTAPLTTTSQGATSSNVKLLCCQSSTAAVDNSQYARTLTNVGTASFVDYVMSLTDRSGNGNTWSFNNQLVLNLPGNRSTANWDIMVDSPTNVFTTATDIGGVVPGNYCTLNPLSMAANLALYQSNLAVYNTSSTDTHRMARGTMGMTTGKWYWEVHVNNSANVDIVGVADDTTGNAGNNYIGGTGKSAGWGYNTSTGSWYQGPWTVNSPTPPAHPSSGIIGVAYDADAGRLWFSSNGNWLSANGGTGNPSTNSNPNLTLAGTAGTAFYPAVSIYYNGGGWVFNFGQRPFAYTPPTGFKSLNTTNLQALGTATIGKSAITPNKWMDIVLSGGSTISRTVSGMQMQPDLVIFKNRVGTSNRRWSWFDSVRGPNAHLTSQNTEAETTSQSDLLTSFNSDGFSVGADAGLYGTNGYTEPWAQWAWKQSPTSGFNIVSYTGNNAARSISHNLGVAPKFMIVKQRTSGSTTNWAVYHASLPSAFGVAGTQVIYLNDTLENQQNFDVWESNNPTSSIFSVGASALTNASGGTYIAYLWAEVPGFSKFGSYIGNGNTNNGPFIYTGFRPKFVLTKCSTGYASYWTLMDTTRDPFNDAAAQAMWPNDNAAESAAYDFDILSNGFKIRATTATLNQSAATYIYAAFAESPFGLNNRAR